METYLADRLNIADLMTGWIHRDNGEWDKLGELFHPEATIAITWFKGKATDFIKGSMNMGSSDFKAKHLVASPVVTFHDHKALAETNASILGQNATLGVGCEGHCRFYGRIEKREGKWKISNRHAIYDMSTFLFPRGVVELDAAALSKVPAGIRVTRLSSGEEWVSRTSVYPTKGSDLEKAIKAEAQTWLKA